MKELTQSLGSYLLSSSSSHLLTPILSLLLSETVAVVWEWHGVLLLPRLFGGGSTWAGGGMIVEPVEEHVVAFR